MSRGVRRRRPSLANVAVIPVLIAVATFLLCSCDSADDLTSHTTSDGVNLPPGTLEPAAPPETGWPPGIATVLLSTGYKLYAIDRNGVKWRQEVQTKREASAPVPFSGVAVSNDRKLIAYIEHRKEIVVRSLLSLSHIS